MREIACMAMGTCINANYCDNREIEVVGKFSVSLDLVRL